MGKPRNTVGVFWSRVDKSSGGCWLWTGGRNTDGYAVFAKDGVRHSGHRFAYRLLVGEVPEGLVLDHLCRVRHCVNPEHLEPVRQFVNIMRGETVTAIHAAKTHCKYGHPFSGDNLQIRVRPRGIERECRACLTAYNARKLAAYYARKAAS